MIMRTKRRALVIAVMLAAFAAAYGSAQQTASAQDIASLAGKWTGYASPTRGSNVSLEVTIQPDGSYTSMWGSKTGRGTVKKEGGKLVAEGQLVTGGGTAAAGVAKSELTVTSKDGKPQKISGVGRDQEGPFNFELTKK